MPNYFITVVGGTVALNIIYDRLLMMVSLFMTEKQRLQNTSPMSRMQKPYRTYPLSDQNGENQYPIKLIYDHNS